jgi:tRNA-2-methylthio-N6-dimethylallyladenosine synthase
MERGYDVEGYVALVGRLRAALPGLALSTDVIVGFPGETEADFEATLEIVRRVRYDSAFLFKYSRREHTKAARWDETVSESEKTHRLQAVIAMQEQVSAEINATWVGREVDVLVEGPAKRRAGWWAGKTPQFKTAVFPHEGAVPGEVMRLRVEQTTAHTLLASG